MATEKELVERQKRELFRLLELEYLNKNITVSGLRRAISEARVVMSKEDIADVEKEIATLYG